MRKDDEFNKVTIINEEGISLFEFGPTQKEESTGYSDNTGPQKDELNEVTVSNGDHAPTKKEGKKGDNDQQLKEQLTNSGSNPSVSGGTTASSAASTASSVAAVAGASLVAVVSIGALVGINVFVNAKCNFHYIEPDANQISYALTLTETNNDDFIISLTNQLLSYEDRQELVEGDNEGVFVDLVPDTEYELTVKDTSMADFELHKEVIKTLAAPADPLSITIYEKGANFEENTFNAELHFDENDYDYFNYVILEMINSEEVSKKINVPLELGVQTLCLSGDSFDETELFVGDLHGFDYYLYYTYLEQDFTSSKKHIVFSYEEVLTYRITLIGGDAGDLSVIDYVNQGEDYLLPSSPFDNPPGLVFAGWDLNGTIYQPGESVRIVRDTTIIAYWEETTVETFTVRFNGGNGTGSMPEVEMEAGEYLLPDCDFVGPTGMEFDYWEVNGESYQPNDPIDVTEDTVVTAMWKTIYVTITFVANNGTDETMDPVTIPYGTNYTLPACPFTDSDEHHMFGGWFINDFGTALNEYSWNVKSDTVLTAYWQECYVITYYAENGTDETYVDKALNNNTLYYTIEECPFTAPDGYYCDGWMHEDLLIGLGSYVSSMDGDISLYAHWSPVPTYHVSYNSHGGYGDMSEYEGDIPQGGEYTLPNCEYEAPDNNYYFANWDVNGVYYSEGETITITEETIISPIWGEKPYYTVTFTPGEGTGENYIVKVYEDDGMVELPHEVPSEFTAPEGYYLTGWMIDDQLYELGDVFDDVTRNITVTAVWTLMPEPEVTINDFTMVGLVGDIENYELRVNLTYTDPHEAVESFKLEIINGSDSCLMSLEPVSGVQSVPFELDSIGLLPDSGICKYVLSYFGYDDQNHTVSSGSVNINELLPDTVEAELLTVNGTNPCFWKDSEKSYIPIDLKFNPNTSSITSSLKARFMLNENGEYTVIQLSDKPGHQVIEIPTLLPDATYGPVPLYGFQIGYGSGDAFTLIEDFGDVSFNQVTSACLVAASFYDSALPYGEDAVYDFVINLRGYNITSLSGYTGTLTFEFKDDEGNVVDTYSMTFALTESNLSHNYVYIDILQMDNTVLAGYEGFIAMARTHVATVTLTYNASLSTTLTLYNNHKFTITY